jgi:hypothetical protein
VAGREIPTANAPIPAASNRVRTRIIFLLIF